MTTKKKRELPPADVIKRRPRKSEPEAPARPSRPVRPEGERPFSRGPSPDRDRPARPFDRSGPPRGGPPRDRGGPPRGGPPRDRGGPPHDRSGPPRDHNGPAGDRRGPPRDGGRPFDRGPSRGPRDAGERAPRSFDRGPRDAAPAPRSFDRAPGRFRSDATPRGPRSFQRRDDAPPRQPRPHAHENAPAPNHRRTHDHDHAHPHDHDHAHPLDHDHAHPHGHAQPHDHTHTHTHDHGHETHHGPAPEPARVLEAGAGRGKTLFFDAFSGAAGDMIIASLVDLGVPIAVVEGAARAVLGDAFELHLARAEKHAIAGLSLHVHEAPHQPARSFSVIRGLLEASSLDPKVKSLALAIFTKLGQAESHAHRVPIEEVHFHEVGGVDAIVDIVGAAAALTHLAPSAVLCSPLPMGRGFIRAAHGRLPNPPPAVLHCLQGVPTIAADLELELVTPTGAAILATVVTGFLSWPALTPIHVGIGAGTRDVPDRPNLLRAILGASNALEARALVELACNVDDMTPELTAHVMDQVLAAGARDAWATPIIMKKGRPATTLHALCDPIVEAAVTGALLRESTTLGVRRSLVSRVEKPRREVVVSTRFGEVPVKVSEGPYGPPVAKPEFEACKALAIEHGVPLREVLHEAALAYGALATSDRAR